MKKLVAFAATMILMFHLTGCGGQQGQETIDSTAIKSYVVDTAIIPAQTHIEILDSTILYDSVEYRHDTIMIDSVVYYIVEGDMRLTASEYFQYKIALMMQRADTSHKLVAGATASGNPIKWGNGDTLRYAVMRRSFPSTEQYNIVRQNFLQAAKEWEGTCNIHFSYQSQFDNMGWFKPKEGLTFIISMANARGKFVASAFFPDDAEGRRLLLVDPSYFSTAYDKIGVFRHEAGHILGFLHEHIRTGAPAACPSELVASSLPLGRYDPNSVMHYFCGGMGDLRLILTGLDRAGAADLYGPPTRNAPMTAGR